MSEVLIVARNPSIRLSVPLGDGVPNLPGAGLGGWTSTEVIEDEALSTWEGQTNLAQDLPLMLDGWGVHPVSVQRDFDTLMKLALVRSNANPPSPPPFQVFGPVHFPGRWWVLPEGGIELSTAEDEVCFLPDGDLYRQALTLHLVAYNRNSGKKPPRNAIANQVAVQGLGEAIPVDYETRKGDTFLAIAGRIYGEWPIWKAISDKNPKFTANPMAPLPVGVKLNLPR